MKLLFPWNVSAVLFVMQIAPTAPTGWTLASFAELTLSKIFLVPLKLATAKIAPALALVASKLCSLFSRKVVFPVNVRMLLRVVIPHPGNDPHSHWLS